LLGLFARTVVVGVDDFVTLVLELLANLLEACTNLLAVALHAFDPVRSLAFKLLAKAIFILIGGIL
jgi:hypothetical protein